MNGKIGKNSDMKRKDIKMFMNKVEVLVQVLAE
ncbi:hypothetical protein A2U01_0103678, partial [Trifolium medium]|nr:hypothetical protein [Trifolium medium]